MLIKWDGGSTLVQKNHVKFRGFYQAATQYSHGQNRWHVGKMYISQKQYGIVPNSNMDSTKQQRKWNAEVENWA